MADKIKQNSPLYVLVKVIMFIIILYILDLTIGSILQYYYFKQDSGFLYRTTYAINETTADILIFGASKANHHYNTKVFEQRFKLSSYNAGRDGSSIFYHYAVLKSVLKRYRPKIIILDISRDFERKQEVYERLSMLLPYYKTHPEIRSIIELKSKYEKFKMVSKVYPYNSMLFSIIVGNSNYNKDRYLDTRGYMPLLKTWNREIKKYIVPDYELDTIKLKIYESFIKDCISSNIKLYIIASPDFINRQNAEKSNEFAKIIAQKHNVIFFDYSNDSMFINHVKYFADYTHLNDEGATLFSNLILDEIEKDMKRNNTKLYN